MSNIEKLLKRNVVLAYISFLKPSLAIQYNTTDDASIATLYSQLLDESHVTDAGDMRYIEISQFEHKTAHSFIFEFFDISVVFGRANPDGTIALFYTYGEPVTQLQGCTHVYPIGSALSCAYECQNGINLTLDDATLLNILIEECTDV